MQVQRTIKAYIHRFVDKINAVILILQKCLQFPQQNGTIRESILKAALYMISNFVLADRVQSMAGMSISVGVETRKTGKNYLKRKV